MNQSEQASSHQTHHEGESITIPLAAEELKVERRAVETGHVRFHKTVQEQGQIVDEPLLREEVTVERHAVNRPVDGSAFNTVREGVIEVTETSEVPVVSKEERVIEEVVVGKEHTERTETVRDTVRRTDVEVEQIAGQTATTGGTPVKTL